MFELRGLYKPLAYLKRDICLLSRHSNDSKLKNCYKWYCKILSDVVKEGKKYHNNRLRFQIKKWTLHELL
jgi:hypothetical protein